MKKRTIALERNAKVFGGDVFTAAPLAFEIGAFLGENLSKTTKSAVLNSSELSFLNGTLMLVPPFFLEVVARVTRRIENGNGPLPFASLWCWLDHG